MNVAITRSSEWTPYCAVTRYDFGEAFRLEITNNYDDDRVCTLEILTLSDSDYDKMDKYVFLERIPKHQAESLARMILTELGV